MSNLKNNYKILGVLNFTQALYKAEQILEESNYYGYSSLYSDKEIRSAYNIIHAIEDVEIVERKEESYYVYN